MTNAVGGGVTVSGGELNVNIENIKHGERFRCKLGLEVNTILVCLLSYFPSFFLPFFQFLHTMVHFTGFLYA